MYGPLRIPGRTCRVTELTLGPVQYLTTEVPYPCTAPIEYEGTYLTWSALTVR